MRIKRIKIYTDGSCLRVGGSGGWAAIIINEEIDNIHWVAGHEEDSNNQRMEILAAIQGLKEVPEGSYSKLYTDDLSLVEFMLKRKNPRRNADLLNELKSLDAKRDVIWKWIKGHHGIEYNEKADKLARTFARAKYLGSQSGKINDVMWSLLIFHRARRCMLNTILMVRLKLFIIEFPFSSTIHI